MCNSVSRFRFFFLQDFDGGEVGQFVSRALVASSGAPTALTWNQVSTDLFPNEVSDLEDAVVQEKAWTIIASTSPVIVRCVIKTNSRASSSVNKNATDALNAAVVAANNSYIANSSISVFVAEARNENA